MSYTFTAFLPTSDPPSVSEAKQYLLEGALFDERPVISVRQAPDGSFVSMELRYDPERHPIVLSRVSGDEAGASREAAIDVATVGGHPEIAAEIEASKLVLAWEVAREELDEDPGSRCTSGRRGL